MFSQEDIDGGESYTAASVLDANLAALVVLLVN